MRREDVEGWKGRCRRMREEEGIKVPDKSGVGGRRGSKWTRSDSKKKIAGREQKKSAYS